MGGVVRYLYRSSLPMHLCPTITILVAGPCSSMAWGPPPEINPPDLSMHFSPMRSNLVLSLSNLVLSDALLINWPAYLYSRRGGPLGN